MHYDLGIIKKE